MIKQILDWQNLCTAWESVADNRGAPGSDAQTIQRFSRHWEANLRRLQQLVVAGRYRPSALRRVAIPKRSGGQRLLSIATVADRILQRAALNVLDPICEDYFYPCSFGYRRGRSLHNATASILHLRDQGFTWVVDADIDECFDSLHHDLLRKMLQDWIDDPRTLSLLGLWLNSGRRYSHPPRGVAQGLPISPLLCNIYLHRLDHALLKTDRQLVRYADDFVILCRSQEQAERVYAETDAILADLRLCYEPAKTRITSFDEGFDFLGVHFEGITWSFNWQKASGEEERVTVLGAAPEWVWNKAPSGYE